jgi:uncharacterized membrane protein
MGSKFFAAPLFALVFAREAAGQGHVNEMRACCRGVPLKVGYFSEELPPYQYYDPGTKVRSGGLVDLNEMIVETMGYDVEWVDMGVTGDTLGVNSAPSYVVMVATGQIDVTLSAPSYGYGPEAVAGRPETSFLTTVPLIDLDTHALIKKERAQRRIFSVFDPFELHLWLSILGALVIGAVFLKVLDELDPREVHVNAGPGGPLAFLYHATSVLFDSDEYEWRSAAARLFRIGLLFFALVTTSTYTASLAALLTTQRYELHLRGDLGGLGGEPRRVRRHAAAELQLAGARRLLQQKARRREGGRDDARRAQRDVGGARQVQRALCAAPAAPGFLHRRAHRTGTV